MDKNLPSFVPLQDFFTNRARPLLYHCGPLWCPNFVQKHHKKLMRTLQDIQRWTNELTAVITWAPGMKNLKKSLTGNIWKTCYRSHTYSLTVTLPKLNILFLHWNWVNRLALITDPYIYCICFKRIFLSPFKWYILSIHENWSASRISETSMVIPIHKIGSKLQVGKSSHLTLVKY